LAFLNLLFGGGFDLRNFDLSYFFGNNSQPSTGCSLSGCSDGGTMTVQNTNDATVTNTVIARANTGGNTASSSDSGDANISTGDAYASANVFNLVNSNFINSNYLLVALNNFGDLSGDITLPGADFFEQLLSMGSGALPRSTTIDNNNTATLNSTSSAQADTGNNTASTTGSGSADIATGNAVSGATTVNQVNTNLVGGTTVYLLINIIGNWTGNVQGLPAGMTWTRTPTGIAIMNTSGSSTGTSGSNPLSSLNVSNNNNATVNNNVQVYALTGSNYAQSGSSSNASISTGNAYASANTVNIVNTNVIGQNWMLAIFNIFGNWSGNLSFGRPDLWIGGVAETPNPTAPGSQVTYKFTVANRGDADATNVKLTTTYNKNLLNFNNDDSASTTPGGEVWSLGDIPHGQTKEFTYTANTGSVPPGNEVPAPLSAQVTSDETDNNMADNTENLSLMIANGTTNFGGSSITPGMWTPDPKITMTKTVSVNKVTRPATVDYKIEVQNNGGAAYNTKLTDTLTDPSGNTVYSRNWSLDTIAPGDDITLTYSVVFSGNSEPGMYSNTAHLTGQKNNPVSNYAVDMAAVDASAQVELDAGDPVATAQTQTDPALPTQCAAFITTYLKPGTQNDQTQVRRLQYFLRDFQGAQVVVNGVFDDATKAAVEKFQNKYSGDILAPWGEQQANGVVYYTTQKKINELYCQGVTQFPLSSAQSHQIASYKNAMSGDWARLNTQTPLSATLFKYFSPITPPLKLSPSPASEPPISTTDQPQDFFSIFKDLFMKTAAQFSTPTAHASTL
jgi:uncharacterized repeat protein (TIGR01451 family)